MTTTNAPVSGPLTRGRLTGRVPVAAPGVSVEWLGPLFRELDSLRSDVAGFVGLATRGPLDAARRLLNAGEFDAVYGPSGQETFLSSAVHGFFANGGTTCWVVRVADRSRAAAAAAQLAPGLVFEASSEGTWANSLAIEVRPDGEGLVSVVVSGGSLHESWPRLDADGLRQVFGDATSTPAGSVSALVRLRQDTTAVSLPTTVISAELDGGHDGLDTLTPAGHLAGTGAGADGRAQGAELLAGIDEVGQLCLPDLVLRDPDNAPGLPSYGPSDLADATTQLVLDCEAVGRTAVLQHPDPSARCDDAVTWREALRSPYAALYWPWLRVPDPARPGEVLAVPPCGHVAGIIARCDLAAGPHMPPANQVVVGAVGLSRRVDDADHAQANDNGVNAVRSLPGRGIRVLGARTTATDPTWRYLNARRLVTQVERSVAAYSEWLVFEPHDQLLRDDVERVIRQFLDDIWRAGGLEGATAADAFSVRVDSAEAAAAVGEGALVVEIGLQPPYPAEYVVVRVDVPDPGAAADRTRGGDRGGDG